MVCSNPKVFALEPKMDVRGRPRPVKSTYEVDFAFGPAHGNDAVYGAVAEPLIDMALRQRSWITLRGILAAKDLYFMAELTLL